LTRQSGIDAILRTVFVIDGKLHNSEDTHFRAINDAFPVFGFALDLGSVNDPTPPTLFMIGLCQNEAIQFLGGNGVTVLPSL